MLRISGPVTLDDMTAVLAPSGTCDPFLWACVRRQRGKGMSFAAHDEQGRALAIGGLYPSAKLREAWLAFAPAAAKRMPALIAAIRLTAAAMPQDDPRPVFALVRSPAGAIIARRLHMRDHGQGVWSYERHRQNHLR